MSLKVSLHSHSLSKHTEDLRNCGTTNASNRTHFSFSASLIVAFQTVHPLVLRHAASPLTGPTGSLQLSTGAAVTTSVITDSGKGWLTWFYPSLSKHTSEDDEEEVVRVVAPVNSASLRKGVVSFRSLLGSD